MDSNGYLVADYLDAVRLRGRSPKTVMTYQQSLGHYLRYLGDRDLTQVSPRVVRGFLAAELEAGTAPTSLVRFHGDLRAFYRWCVKEGEVEASPLDRIPAPSAPIPHVPTVDSDDVRKLLAVKGRTKFLDARNKLVLSLLFDTGIRIGELLNLGVDDVQTSTETIVVTGKTGYRVVGFGATTATALRRYLRVRSRHARADLPELFVTVHGPLKYNAVRHMLAEACDRAGVPRVRAHQARHTWATRHLEADDVSDLTVMAAGGWSGTRHLQRYTRTASQRRAAELNRKNSVVDNL